MTIDFQLFARSTTVLLLLAMAWVVLACAGTAAAQSTAVGTDDQNNDTKLSFFGSPQDERNSEFDLSIYHESDEKSPQIDLTRFGNQPESSAAPLTPTTTPVAQAVPTQATIAAAALARTRSQPLPTRRRRSGYIDSAIVGNNIRFRFDNFEEVQFANRAEYLFPAPFSLGGRATFAASGAVPNYQEYRTYFEVLLNQRTSFFSEFVARVVDADALLIGPANFGTIIGLGAVTVDVLEAPQAGASDVNLGLRYALVQTDDRFVTAQLRAYAPTGDPTICLGTGHSSVELGLLFRRNCSPRFALFGEIQDWQAIDASRLRGSRVPPELVGEFFGGNVLRYGIGGSYELMQRSDECLFNQLGIVVEMLGWTVLDGLKAQSSGALLNFNGVNVADFDEILDAKNDSIVNLKLGVRAGTSRGGNLFFGYGHGLTGDRWYREVIRIEYRRDF